MGTSFLVTYATIFMIWLETPIIEEFREHHGISFCTRGF